MDATDGRAPAAIHAAECPGGFLTQSRSGPIGVRPTAQTHRLIQVERPADLERFLSNGGVSPLTPDEFVRDRPDTHWIAQDGDGRLAARCSLWWTATPSFQGRRLGFVGHCAASDRVAAASVLRQAVESLAAAGCALVLAPIDGSTWRRYRVITERGSEPSFLFEPDLPGEWASHLSEAGFAPWSRYYSAATSSLTRSDARVEAAADRLNRTGVTIRPLRLAHADDDLRRIYRVTIASFRRSLLFESIDEAAFLEQHRPLLRMVDPNLVLIAEHGGSPVGFVFAVPDAREPQSGRVIVKTIAVIPGRAYAGLGGVLASRCEQTAAGLGYGRAIHALMHESSLSRNISRRYAATIRGYTLFARTLS